jgi:glutamyl-tRNA reductase
MDKIKLSKHRNFYAVGLSYKTADADRRGKFNLDQKAKNNLLQEAQKMGFDSLLVICTCNRTELYGFAENPSVFSELLVKNSVGTAEEFREVAYLFTNEQAITHLFRVGTGLDSQILGDFEIISQLKSSAVASKSFGLLNAFLERLVNVVIQASKKIKTETAISSGATSVSFASVQYILNQFEDVSSKHILLFGTGKIGRNTCENLIKHTKNDHITLINRTKGKAEKIAGKFNLIVKDYADLEVEIQKADVLVVATGAQNPTVDKTILSLKKELLILDLSIPKNVHDNVTSVKGVSLVHLDHLTQMTDKTLEKRKQQIPAAEGIIREIESEFLEWMDARKFAPTIQAIKERLNEIKFAELNFQRKKIIDFDEVQAEIISDRIIHKITTQFANHLKDSHTSIDESIDFIEKIFQISTNNNSTKTTKITQNG